MAVEIKKIVPEENEKSKIFTILKNCLIKQKHLRKFEFYIYKWLFER